MNENPFIGLNEAKLSKIYNDQRNMTVLINMVK